MTGNPAAAAQKKAAVDIAPRVGAVFNSGTFPRRYNAIGRYEIRQAFCQLVNLV